MAAGWVKIHRSMQDSNGYFSEPFCRNMAWVDMIMLANTKPGWYRCRNIRVNVGRGQIGHGLDTLAQRWKWSRGKVERFFKELEMDKQIVRQKSNVTTLISIVNYEHYQTDGTADNKPNELFPVEPAAQQPVQQPAANNNDKNVKKSAPLPITPEEEAAPLYAAFVDVWFKFYAANFTDDQDPTKPGKPHFNKIAGRKIKDIIEVAEGRAKAAGKAITEADARAWFVTILTRAYGTWIKDSFTLGTIHQQIEVLINKPNNATTKKTGATNGTGNAKLTGTMAVLQNLTEGVAMAAGGQTPGDATVPKPDPGQHDAGNG